jgi:predicted transcriptional regulator of viral defense system
MHVMHANTAPDRRIAAIASRQHGIVTRADLYAAGLRRGAIAHRLSIGRLHVIHSGVYAVGHTNLTRTGRWLAAVFYGGDGALLSHVCAGAHYGIRPASPTKVDVVLPSRAGRDPHDTIRFHRPRMPVPEAERHVHEAIPITSISRTLLDLAAVVSAASLARAVERAVMLGLFDMRAMQQTLDRHPRHAGRKRLEAVLETYRDDVLTRSELEALFLQLCAQHAIPAPAVNALVEGLEVDFSWRAQRLVVETDGHRDHGGRAAFERDRARDARLTLAGQRVVRFTYRQITSNPVEVAKTVRALLNR